MTQDLFLKQSMKQRVSDFAREKKFIVSYELDDFKMSLKGIPGYRHIDRRARELVVEKVLRRLRREEKILLGYNPKYFVYEYIEK